LIPIRERTRFPASLLSRLPALEFLALTGRNSGHVDVAAATARGVLVAETAGSSVAAIELTFGLIIATVRRIAQEDRALRAGRWQTSIGLDLAGKTLGVVGLGRIGSRVAAFGQFLGMRVLAWGPTLTPERAGTAGVTYTSLEQLMAESDVVTVHTRLSPLTRGLITARHLALMKPTAFLINTARGPIVDEAALVEVLRQRRIAGAGLDVFDVEPLPPDHPLLGLDNVVLTPHIGYVTREAYEAFFRGVVENIEAFLEGKVPPRTLNPEAMGRRRPG
jgi:phosphoglycerate dehydrogenase-like enzyme